DGRAAVDEAEALGEYPLDLIVRDGEGRTVLALAEREEAGEQRAARPKDRVNRAHVLVASSGIDRAEARVFPEAVEEAGVRRGEREDVALLVCDGDTLLLRERSRLVDGGVREVEAPGAMSVPGQQPSVVATARARDGDTRGAGVVSRREPMPRIEPGDERRCGCAELPAVLAAGVQLVPESRRAYGRAIDSHSSPSKSAIVSSAPASSSSSAVCAVVTPIARIPARRAACTPTSESSNTRQTAGDEPSRRAHSRYTWGSGLLNLTSSAVTMTS